MAHSSHCNVRQEGELRIESKLSLITEDESRRWSNAAPILFGSLEDVREFPDAYLSNPIPPPAMKLIEDLAVFWSQPASRKQAIWNELFQLSQPAQERLAAGFELIARKK